MMRIRSVLLSCLAFVLAAHAALAQPIPRAEPESVGLSAARLQRLTGVFQGYADEGRLAGAVALVARQGKVAYLGAFGERDRESGSPMTGDTIFRIASQTKALVSVGIMMLQEEGRLLLSDSVGKYIPELTRTTVAVLQDDGGYDVVDADRPITLRQLLTHTACISYGYGIARDRWAEAGIQGWYFADRDEPVGATVSRMAALPFECQPGERLGMHDTHFYLPAGKVDRLATVYSASEEDGLDRAPDGAGMDAQGNYVEGPRKAFSGGAGLLSTASDYARFLQMLLNGGELDGVRVLSPKTVELMTVDHLDGLEFEPGLGFGLGFRVTVDVGARGVPGSLGEYGWGGAYHSTYWVDPEEELVVVYFTQLRPSGDLDDHAKLRALVYQAIVEPGRER
jgi:CubicO group peptidase (beta-lactamase class C family)